MRPVKTSEILEYSERLGITGIVAPPGAGGPVQHLVRYAGNDGGRERPVPRHSLVIVPRNATGWACDKGWSGCVSPAYSGSVSCVALSAQRLTALHQQFSESTETPVFSSSYDDSLLYSRLTGLLREIGERQVMVHGVLLRIAGIGVLIIGESGIGKTACGLALMAEDSHWVADDAVILKGGGSAVYGRGHRRTAGWIAVRNRGILRAVNVVGEERLLPETRVDLVARLVRGFATKSVPEAESFHEIAGVSLPYREFVACADPTGMAEMVRDYVCRIPVPAEGRAG